MSKLWRSGSERVASASELPNTLWYGGVASAADDAYGAALQGQTRGDEGEIEKEMTWHDS